MDQDPHVRRLLVEQERLINLTSRSKFIKIEPVEVVPGMPPDKYVITFTCKGIERINEKDEPIAARFHQVAMYISREFPRQEPHLKWLTPIWHPNVDHDEPHHVCTNNVQNFYSTKGLDELVLWLGEMVQYKRYHAAWLPPYPQDREVAKWVVEYAEPHGIVGPDKPFDNQPLLREYKIRGGKGGAKPAKASAAAAPPAERGRIKLGSKRGQSGPLPPPTAELARKTRIKLGAKRNS
jgi:ubiquitin-protein ligase